MITFLILAVVATLIAARYAVKLVSILENEMTKELAWKMRNDPNVLNGNVTFDIR